tara:strand:- start:47 stop:2533 length:2487 start_codon:yes stop_codon:yes gene_type:complete
MDNFEKIITQIRKILRINGITGMESINHCITFIIIKYMDTSTCELLNIPIEYSYNNLIDMIDSDTIHNDDVYKHLYNKIEPCMLRYIHSEFKFTNIKFKLESIEHIIKIIKLVDTLDLEELESSKDIIGTIYELHLKTGSTGGGMRDLGQYFTSRYVINYMIELCNPKMIGNRIEKIIDPTCGTGGFLTMAVKYLNKKYQNIDWEQNKDKIIGFDLDINVVNITKINLLIESKKFMDNIICRDTLYKDMKISEENSPLTADVLLCNEPMGITNLIHSSCCNRIKELAIRGTKAEPLFLQLFMEALNVNGRCAVVVPDGVLFNESNLHQGTRKKLIEEFNLVKVITLNDKEFFLNTGVQTSILYFENNGKTEKTTFSSISLNSDELVEDIIMDVDYDTLVKNNYSLFINKYKRTDKNKISGIKYLQINDISKINLGKSISKKDLKNGNYNVIGGGISYMGKHNQTNVENNTITIGKIGANAGNIQYHLDKVFVTSNACYLTNINNNVKYIYYILKYYENIIKSYVTKTGQPSLEISMVKELEIPIPSLEVQNAIVEQLDIINENNATCQKQIDEFKKIMKYYVETNSLFGEEKRLGDICEVETGEYIKKCDMVKGKYPVYGGGDASNYINRYNRENTFVIAKDGVSLNCIRYVNEKFFLNHHGWTINLKTNDIKNYIYYVLLNNQKHIFDLAMGSAQKGINQNIFYDFKIKVVSPEEQQKIVDYCDNLQMMIDKLEENIENNNILMKTILENKLKQQSDNKSDNKSDNNSKVNIVSDTELTSQNAIIKSLNDDNLSKLSVKDLKKMCKEKKIKGYSKMKKNELINVLNN